MYNVSKLSGDSKAFLQNLPLVTKSNQEITAMALSKAIANELQLPSSPVESASDFYLQTVYLQVRDAVSTLNELVVVDLNRVQELVKTFWLVRYNVLFPRKKLFLTNAVVSESHFFGFSSFLSPDDAVFIQNNTITLLQVCNGFSQIISEISVSEEVAV